MRSGNVRKLPVTKGREIHNLDLRHLRLGLRDVAWGCIGHVIFFRKRLAASLSTTASVSAYTVNHEQFNQVFIKGVQIVKS